MRIAFFSPLSPLRTGIADYSTDIVQALKQRSNIVIDLWIESQPVPSKLQSAGFAICDYSESDMRQIREKLKSYDLIVYHMGNNLRHRRIYQIAIEIPGLLVLHDFVLIAFFTGLGVEAMNRELAYTFGLNKIEAESANYEEIKRIVIRNKFQYPLCGRLILNSLGVITHSNFVMNHINTIFPGVNALKINHYAVVDCIDVSVSEVRDSLGVSASALLVSSFGFFHKSKRIPQILRALSGLAETLDIHCALVGEVRDPEIVETIRQYNLEKRVTLTGYVDHKLYRDLIETTDIVMALRAPTQGETSGNLCRALGAGKACMVSSVGWFAELPDDVVCKIPVNKSEINAIQDNILFLGTNDQAREKMEKNAKSYAKNHLNLAKITDQYTEAFHLFAES